MEIITGVERRRRWRLEEKLLGRDQDVITAESVLTTFQTTLYAAREHLRIEQKKAR